MGMGGILEECVRVGEGKEGRCGSECTLWRGDLAKTGLGEKQKEEGVGGWFSRVPGFTGTEELRFGEAVVESGPGRE